MLRHHSSILAATLAAIVFAATGSHAAEFPLTVREPAGIARHHAPITSGVPFGKGELRSADAITLLTTGTKPAAVPLQTEVLARWADGSIKWLLLDFQADLPANKTTTFVVKYGPGVTRPPVTNPIVITDGYEGLSVDTGRLRMHVDRKNFRPLTAIWLDRNQDGRYTDEERITHADSPGLSLTTPDGNQFHAHRSPIQITREQQGPLRTCLKLNGTHKNENGHFFRYIIRLHLFRGKPDIRIDYTFVNDNAAKTMSRVASLNCGWKLAGTDPAFYHLEGPRTDPTRLFQVDDRRFRVNNKPAGRTASGWAATWNRQGGIAVGVRQFWQNWPKSLSVGQRGLSVGILPGFAKGTYDGRPIRDEAKLFY